MLTAAFAACGRALPLPTGYALRAPVPAEVEALAAAGGLAAATAPLAPGDVVLLRVGPAQHHCANVVPAGHVHAHAGLRRVVLTPGAPTCPILRRWRLA